MKKTEITKIKDGKIRILREYEFDLSDFVIDRLPSSCYSCPSGFSTIPGKPCGRNVPFRPEDATSRPSTCKLRELDKYLVLSKLIGR